MTVGIESLKDSTIPALVASLDGIRIRSVACGSHHTVAVAENGSLYAWGKNSNGQCGLGHTNNVLSPVSVSSLLQADVRIHVAAAGTGHTLCVSEAGILFSFGRGEEGQLGLGDSGGTLHHLLCCYQIYHRHCQVASCHAKSV
jgi:alpha-tubulin suppressor-like RCC1 family protein